MGNARTGVSLMDIRSPGSNPVRTSQETHYVAATKRSRLILFRETVAVYCENHTEHTDTLCGSVSK
jgi:hypothetical protein